MGHLSHRSMLISSVVALTVLITLPAMFHERARHSMITFASNIALQRPLCTAVPVGPWADPSTEPVHDLALVPQRRKRVAVASVFGAHFDVYMALVGTLEKVMAADQHLAFEGGVDTPSVQVYAPPFLYGFEEVADRLELYKGVILHPDQLIEDVHKGDIDLVILGTCEIDMPRWHDELLDAWDTRDDVHKFKLVCIVHHAQHDWQDRMPAWSLRDAIRLLPISEQCVAPGELSPQVTDHPPPDDPGAWGYLHAVDGLFLPDPAVSSPFELLLVGSGEIVVPTELSRMVTIHRGLRYSEFYELVAGSDIVVPCFAPDGGYYDYQASSSVALAVELNVPILATRRMRQAYTYIDDDRAVITRPSGIRELIGKFGDRYITANSARGGRNGQEWLET
ncbi:hypothetical protein PUNSTDRAFT_46854 [Punctularia strigosozonata HHB-11173 SS5]|uniref:uncharacterized protein n=1 Tax=Punctularia strigosozonata (strain HHB-11173) TaxID=741275 RepID=UPI0004417E68|nr:uncharacterized protein PUNSTDRAFT_46854 [Punctularia strigosozonata HHB-11173 SS5]EIN05497.1 hypothetical protein PUNSTDRAFT_46854 [Punctularia strigosozonata HHB-11173 SS5]